MHITPQTTHYYVPVGHVAKTIRSLYKRTGGNAYHYMHQLGITPQKDLDSKRFIVTNSEAERILEHAKKLFSKRRPYTRKYNKSKVYTPTTGGVYATGLEIPEMKPLDKPVKSTHTIRNTIIAFSIALFLCIQIILIMIYHSFI